MRSSSFSQKVYYEILTLSTRPSSASVLAVASMSVIGIVASPIACMRLFLDSFQVLSLLCSKFSLRSLSFLALGQRSFSFDPIILMGLPLAPPLSSPIPPEFRSNETSLSSRTAYAYQDDFRYMRASYAASILDMNVL